MNAATRRSAIRAIAVLKALARARLRGGEIVLPDGGIFRDRELGDCFEAGDGEEVVVLIMHTRDSDAELRDALVSGYARDHVDLDGWLRTLRQWEDRKPGLLSFEEDRGERSPMLRRIF
jgi:hypothetical protein